jgi:hypothetical protein
VVIGKTRNALLVALALVGCDLHMLRGPTIANGYGFDVKLTVDYSSGPPGTVEWPPCQATAIGRDQLTVEKIEIEKDGKILQSLNAAEMPDLAKDVGAKGTWIIDGHGVHHALGNARCDGTKANAR